MSDESDPTPILVVVMGVASTGKTTIAKALNARLGLPYVEGDDLHPASNIAKMSAGVPLTDADREPWLALIRTTAEHLVAAQQAASHPSPDGAPRRGRVGVMVTCSALRRYYRDILRGTHRVPGVPEHLAPAPAPRLATYFVYIKPEERLLRERIAARQGHFMKPQMLDSQLATLESPEGEEGVVVIPLDASTEEQVEIALEGLTKLIGPLNIEPAESKESKQGKPEAVDVPEEVRGEPGKFT